ncbi:MAG: hypothetical protein KDK25_09760, partial [Leptospiraceae bacterium]|nr:hypothetical protein [Leptospiraceae bacterium]
FRWAGPCPCKLVVQPADPSREALVREGITGNDVELSLEEGIYSWYVENENSRSPGRGFRLLKEPELKILQPASGAELSIRGSSGLILISWDSPGLSRKHRLDISGSADMSSVLQSVNTMRNSAVVSLPEGQYYVRVSSESMPGQDYSSEGISSAVVAFKVKPFEKEDQEIAVNLQDDAKKSRPERQPTPTNQATPRIARTYAIFPLPNASVDMSNRESLMFRWTAVGGAEKYLFRLYRDDSILIEKFVTEPYLNFRELTLLDTAWFEWSVEPFFADTRSARGFQHRFQITLSQQLEKPELQE